MTSSFWAELLKIRRRAASWVLVSVLILLVAVAGYATLYLSIENTDVPGDLDAQDQQAFEEAAAESNTEFLQMLVPRNVLVNVLSTLSLGGGTVALIFGALIFGSEYNWGTLKTVLSRHPGKSKMFLGKILAILACSAGLSVMALLVGGMCSYVIASLEELPAKWPQVWEIIGGVGAGCLILATWAMLGAFVATLLESASLAIGIGLGYVIVVEQTAVSLGASIQNDIFQSLLMVLPGTNSTALAEGFGRVPDVLSASIGETVQPTQAATLLGAYSAILVILTIVLFWRRDVH